MKRFGKFLINLFGPPVLLAIIVSPIVLFTWWLSKFDWVQKCATFLWIGGAIICFVVMIIGIIKEAWEESGKD